VLLLEALLMRQVQEGLRGQLRAIESLLDRYERHVGSEAEPSEELPDEDLLLLRRALARRGRDRPADNDDPGHGSCTDRSREGSADE
jgi:hypothetical protein